jgi:hypothetical protein
MSKPAQPDVRNGWIADITRPKGTPDELAAFIRI